MISREGDTSQYTVQITSPSKNRHRESSEVSKLPRHNQLRSVQSQKTEGFCVAHFATLSDATRSRLKIFLLFIWIKESCVRKFEGLARSKLLGISQTIVQHHLQSAIQVKCQNRLCPTSVYRSSSDIIKFELQTLVTDKHNVDFFLWPT